MLDSGYDYPRVILKNRASGHEKNDARIVNAMIMEMATPFGGGSMYSMVWDLERISRSLRRHKSSRSTTDAAVFQNRSG